MGKTIKRFISTLAPSCFSEVHSTIKQLVLNGKYDQALELYSTKIHCCSPSYTSTIVLLPSIIKTSSHAETHQFLGLQLHCHVLKNGYSSEFGISNSFESMYRRFLESKDAYLVFDKMSERDTIS
ncbi:hypothetical protein P3S68_003969 [Capsicum galapagoense]